MSSPKTRPREHEEVHGAPDAKRAKLDGASNDEDVLMTETCEVAVVSVSELEEQAEPASQEPESLLPPSHTLLNAPPPVFGPDGSMQQIMETDVGISEYVGHDVPKIGGIIKQRCAYNCGMHGS